MIGTGWFRALAAASQPSRRLRTLALASATVPADARAAPVVSAGMRDGDSAEDLVSEATASASAPIVARAPPRPLPGKQGQRARAVDGCAREKKVERLAWVPPPSPSQRRGARRTSRRQRRLPPHAPSTRRNASSHRSARRGAVSSRIAWLAARLRARKQSA
eukprot:3454187-Pleurochrysis_carterae.AAC.6